MPVIKRIKFIDNCSCQKRYCSEENEELETEVLSEKILKSFKSELGVDSELLGREGEFKEIRSFIEQMVKSGSSGVIFISGSPGTGKTFLVERTLNLLQQKKSANLGFTLPYNYKIVRTNASRIISCLNGNKNQISISVFVHLLNLMNTPKTNVERLNLIFKSKGFKECIEYFILQISKRRVKYIVFIDEIDLIRGGRSNYDIISELFRVIIENPHSGLILAAVSNNVNIGNDIVKKLGIDIKKDQRVKLMVFSPYDHNTLRNIVMQRIENVLNLEKNPIINKAGIELCVRKVASIYGDCRRTLDACYLAIGKYITKQVSELENEVNQTDNDDISLVGGSSTASTRENSPTSERIPEYDSFTKVPLRKRARSMPLTTAIPIGEFQHVMSNIHHSNQSRIEIIRNLPLHQQYVIMSIVLVMIDEYSAVEEKNLRGNSCCDLPIDKLTNNRVSSTLVKTRYNSICKEFLSAPEDFKEILDSLESINVISTGGDLAPARRKSSSFGRNNKHKVVNNEIYIDLLFAPEQITNTLTTLPKLGTVFSNLLPSTVPGKYSNQD